VKRKVIVVTAAVVMLASCGSASADDGNGWDQRFATHTKLIEVDGRTIPCIGITNGNGISLSCDWAAK
jgi:hypothetical protein